MKVRFILLLAFLFQFALFAEKNNDNVKVPLQINPVAIHPKIVNTKSLSLKKKAKSKKDTQKKKSKKQTASQKVPASKTSQGAVKGGSLITPPADGQSGMGTPVKVEAPKVAPIKKNTKVKLYFPDTPLMDVIKWFALMTQRNFILADARLGKSKVHILSTKPVTLGEAYRTFLLLLAINDYSVTLSGRYTVIRKERSVPSSGISFYKNGKVPNLFRMVATIMKFKYISAQKAEKMLKLFKDKGGTTYVVNDETLIVIDYAANIRKMQDIIREVDVRQRSNSASLHFIPVHFIPASDAKKIVEDIFKDFTKRRSNKKGHTNNNVPVLKGIASASPKQAASRAVAEQIEDLGNGPMYLHVVADDRGEQLIILANQQVYNLIVQVVKMVDREMEGEGEIHVVKLQNAKAKDMVKTLSKIAKNRRSKGKKKRKGADVFEGEISISANEPTNSLVIVSSFRDFKNLKRVIEKLDVRRKQVFVEAAILEVSVDDSLEYGNVFASGGFTTTISGDKVPVFFGKALSNPKPGFLSGILSPAIQGSEGVPGLGLTGGVPSLGLILNAAKDDANVNVLSTPHLMTTDNEEAEIIVGETIPFPTGNIINGVAGSQITYKREDVALKLKIKPQINESGYMTLDINQEITELGKNTDYGYATTKRQAKTIINAENEQTIVIGGLMKTVINESESKIPFFGDIPVLGALFKYKKKSEKKVNLLIIITPHIVEGKDDFARILDRKLKERRDFARKFYGSLEEYKGTTFMSKKRGALLALARALAHADVVESEELERLHKLQHRRALLFDAEGGSREINLDNKKKNEEKEEEIPVPDDDELIEEGDL